MRAGIGRRKGGYGSAMARACGARARASGSVRLTLLDRVRRSPVYRRVFSFPDAVPLDPRRELPAGVVVAVRPVSGLRRRRRAQTERLVNDDLRIVRAVGDELELAGRTSGRGVELVVDLGTGAQVRGPCYLPSAEGR
jgi:hypothetical protein